MGPSSRMNFPCIFWSMEEGPADQALPDVETPINWYALFNKIRAASTES